MLGCGWEVKMLRTNVYTGCEKKQSSLGESLGLEVQGSLKVLLPYQKLPTIEVQVLH